MWIFKLVKPAILIFWTKFAPKEGIFGAKWKKWTPPLNSTYSNQYRYQISTQTNNFDFFEQIYPKRVFLVESRKHHHWILHIWIGLGTKFQLRPNIFIFGSNLPKKGASALKLKTHIFACVHGRISLFQFLILNPLSYCFKDMIGFDVKASFASCPMSRLIRWYNKPGDITKELRKGYSVPR